MRAVHGWRRVLRWVEGVLIALVGLVLIAVAVLVVGMQTHAGRELVRKQIVAKLGDTFIGGATIGSIEGTPFTDIVLHDLVINGADRKPVVKIGALHLHVGLLPLVSHQLVLKKLEVDDLDVALDRGEDGSFRIQHLTKPGPASTWNVWLPKAEIHRGHVMIETTAGGEIVDLDNLEIAANVKMPHGGPLDASAQLSAIWRQKAAPIDIGAALHNDPDRGMRVPSAYVKLADIAISAVDVKIPKDSSAYSGVVVASVPATTVSRLRPQIQDPLDVAFAARAVPVGDETDVTLDGEIGGAPLHLRVKGDPNAKTAAGNLALADLDLYAATHGQTDGLGAVRAKFAFVKGDGDAEATVTTSGAIDSTIDAVVHKRGDAIALEHATIVAKTHNVIRGTGGKAPVRGLIDVDLAASGAVAPRLDLAVQGHADGQRIRVKDLYAGVMHLNIDAAHVPSHPLGHGRVELIDLARGDMQLGKLTVAAGNRPDNKVQVSVRSQPKQAPWMIDLDALVTPGDTIGVDLQRHIVRAADGATWHGKTGHVAISPTKIELRDFTSASRDGTLALAASYIRAGRGAGDVSAKLEGSMDLSNLDKTVKGRANGTVDVQRRGTQLYATVDAKGQGLSLQDVAFDSHVKVQARPGHVTADVSATSARAGSADIALDLDAPANLANAAAWKTLTRRAIKKLEIKLDHADIKTLAKMAGSSDIDGSASGDIVITGTDTHGTVQVRDARGRELRDLGNVNVDLELAQPAKDTVDVKLTGQVQKVGGVGLAARFAVPERVFDPLAWKRLGAGAVRGACLKTSDVAFEPGTLQRLGIVTNLRGKAAVQAEVGPGLDSAHVALDVTDVRGGPLAWPVEGHIDAKIDQKTAHAEVGLRTRRFEIMRGQADLATTIDRLRADPEGARATPLKAVIEFPNVDAKRLARTFGNTQVNGGTLDGRIDIAGTVGRPTAIAKLTAKDITTPPDEGNRPVPVVKEMTIDASWDGATGKVAIVGNETNGGTLKITANANKDALADGTASVVADKIDIAPLVAFLPGPAGGLGGRLDANLTVHGLEPKTAQFGGNLHITEGRVPIAPAVGTLFHGDVAVKVANNGLQVAAAGKLGNGNIELKGTAPLTADGPVTGQLQLTMRKVQLIGTTEPIIDGTVTAKIERTNDAWHADVHVSKAAVRIPGDKGEKLAPVGAPPDVVYGGQKHYRPPTQVAGAPVHRAAPSQPFLVADIQLDATKVESKEIRGDVAGKVQISVGGKEVGVVGNLGLLRGDLDLFDRRYQVDKAAVHFDGSTDPVLDIRITHDFPDVTTITEIHGRASAPQLELSSNPGIYSQSELLGFLLGGEPGGDPNQAPSAEKRVAAAGESYLANKVGGYVKEALPVDVDVLRYESATANSSAAVTVGTWLTHTLFLAWRQHLEARPDENAGEGEIEYWLKRRLVIEATIGDRGYDGADLLWRRRW